MARWQLTAGHYLNTLPNTEWEQKETSTETGRQLRKVYPVPTLLNPDDPNDQTPRGSGVINVCWEGKGQPTDIIFLGPPTPDMTPLDDEAESVTDGLRPQWQHPIESLPGQSASLAPETLAMMEAFAKQIGESITVPNKSISREEFDEMKTMMATLKKRNEELEKQVAMKKVS